jgi:hypothetical protein
MHGEDHFIRAVNLLCYDTSCVCRRTLFFIFSFSFAYFFLSSHPIPCCVFFFFHIHLSHCSSCKCNFLSDQHSSGRLADDHLLCIDYHARRLIYTFGNFSRCHARFVTANSYCAPPSSPTPPCQGYTNCGCRHPSGGTQTHCIICGCVLAPSHHHWHLGTGIRYYE